MMQADICHAYQILKKGGVKDENIVVFMYDDIAMNELNPRKGVLINHPTGGDVYAGVPKVTFSTQDKVTLYSSQQLLLFWFSFHGCFVDVMIREEGFTVEMYTDA